MNETSSPRLPMEVHTDCRVAAESNHPYHTIPPKVKPAPTDNLAPRSRFANLRVGLVCLAMTVGLGAVLIPALRVAYDAMDGTISSDRIGQALGQGLLQGGMPPTNIPLTGENSPDTETAAQDGTDPIDGGGEVTEPLETAPSEAVTDSLIEPVTEPSAYETVTTPANDPPTDTIPRPETTEASTAEEETDVPVPEGCYPFVSVDMSDADHGAGYVISDMDALPQHLPDGRLWNTEGAPTVLMVNTHPYEGYSGGEAWYDPAEGGLALTDTPNATDGMVALGAALARTLRGMGVTVIHLRIAVSAEDTAADIYDRTETMIRYYCRLYPDVGLVVNLRRSAELTEDGSILRTAGSYGGEVCAQVRISVNGGRGKHALGRDLAVALALREGLWGIDPTVSRPVWVKEGSGLISDRTDVCVLTLEAGSAGNTYAEAKRLVDPLALILGDLILEGK